MNEPILRDDSGRFVQGTAPGPGRPINSRPRLVTALRQALDEDPTLERLREVAIRKLEEGDPQFWRMLLDRTWPTKLELTNEMREPLVVRWQSPLDLEVAPKD